MTNENPRVILPLFVAAMASMGLLFGATLSNTNLEVARTSINEVVAEPVASIFDTLGEAGYATAVELGAIPFEQSIYAVADFPVNHTYALSGRVAGSSVETSQYSVTYTQEGYVSPWAGLYKLFE